MNDVPSMTKRAKLLRLNKSIKLLNRSPTTGTFPQNFPGRTLIVG
ncbi:hypothetical protein [Spirosoma endbachense]|nr:hypothetical protein [Spirosoma endbachense]